MITIKGDELTLISIYLIILSAKEEMFILRNNLKIFKDDKDITGEICSLFGTEVKNLVSLLIEHGIENVKFEIEERKFVKTIPKDFLSEETLIFLDDPDRKIKEAFNKNLSKLLVIGI